MCEKFIYSVTDNTETKERDGSGMCWPQEGAREPQYMLISASSRIQQSCSVKEELLRGDSIEPGLKTAYYGSKGHMYCFSQQYLKTSKYKKTKI
jgi:hypothetical protein